MKIHIIYIVFVLSYLQLIILVFASFILYLSPFVVPRKSYQSFCFLRVNACFVLSTISCGHSKGKNIERNVMNAETRKTRDVENESGSCDDRHNVVRFRGESQTCGSERERE